MGRRPLSDREYVDSIGVTPWLLNHMSKVWRVLPGWNYTDEDSAVKTSILGLISPNKHTSKF